MAVRDFAYHSRRFADPARRAEVATQLSRLDSFRSLQTGWDSYEAEPPNETALENARQVLLLFMESESSLPVRVAPSAEGGVALIFSKGDSSKYADIECFNDGEILAITSKPAQEPTIWPLTLDEEAPSYTHLVRFCMDRSSL